MSDGTKWFPAPRVIARRGDAVVVNESNLGDRELMAIAFATCAGLGRMPTKDEADEVLRWAVRARAAGGEADEILRNVVALGLPIVAREIDGEWFVAALTDEAGRVLVRELLAAVDPTAERAH